MSSYTSTGSYLSTMDDTSTTTSRTRSNSLFENPTPGIATESRRRSNSLFESPAPTGNFVSSPTPLVRRTSSVHNSVIQAMITSNNLRNCREVEEMLVQCLNNNDKESFVCKTAQRYIGGCQR